MIIKKVLILLLFIFISLFGIDFNNMDFVLNGNNKKL